MATAETWLDTVELAEYLKIPRRTLDTWAYKGTGPKYTLMGRHRRYKLSNVERWADDRAKGGEA